MPRMNTTIPARAYIAVVCAIERALQNCYHDVRAMDAQGKRPAAEQLRGQT